MIVGRFPIFGLYVQMFNKGNLVLIIRIELKFLLPVAVNFSKFLMAYSCLLMAFALSFCILFSSTNSFRNVPK